MITPRYSKFGRYFDYTKLVRSDGTWFDGWTCRMCGQIIKANTAGAQSHLAKHLRANTQHELVDQFARER